MAMTLGPNHLAGSSVVFAMGSPAHAEAVGLLFNVLQKCSERRKVKPLCGDHTSRRLDGSNECKGRGNGTVLFDHQHLQYEDEGDVVVDDGSEPSSTNQSAE